MSILKELRKSKKLTQLELGIKTGISQSYISELEKETFVNSPTLKQIIVISFVLDANIIDVLMFFARKEILHYNKKYYKLLRYLK